MSKYTRFTTTRKVPRTLQLGSLRISFITNEYTTDDPREIKALKDLAEAPKSGVQAHAEKVDYLTPREVSRQQIQRAVTGIQGSAKTTIQNIRHPDTSVPLMERVAQAATPQAEVPKSEASKAAQATKITTAEAAEVLKTVTPSQTTSPLAPKTT